MLTDLKGLLSPLVCNLHANKDARIFQNITTTVHCDLHFHILQHYSSKLELLPRVAKIANMPFRANSNLLNQELVTPSTMIQMLLYSIPIALVADLLLSSKA